MRLIFLLLASLVLISCSGSGSGEPDSPEAKAFRERAAGQPGAVKTSSGLIYRQLRAGSGPSPAANDSVKVHYRGTLIDGTEFDSSYKRNEPQSFRWVA